MRPNKKQKEAIRLMLTSKKPVLWAGSIRSGKTVGGAMGLLLHAQSRENGRYILAGKSNSAIKRNILPALYECSKSWKIPCRFHHSTQTLKVHTSEIHVVGANNEASQDYIQGMTADGFFLDELPLLPKSFFVQAVGRCSKPNPFMFLSMNKVSPNHWTKTELVDTEIVELIESLIADNPAIDEEAFERFNTLISGHYHARMVNNEWADATGRIWPDPIFYQKELSDEDVYFGIDAAQSGTTAAVFLKKINPRLWVIFDEYKFEGVKSFDEHAQMIKQYNPVMGFCDPSAPGLIAALRKAGVQVSPGNNKVEKGLQAVDSALTRGIIQYVKCPNLLKEMSGYVWDEKAALQGEDKPVKNRDHFCDALRYFVMGKIPMISIAPVTKRKDL